MRVRIASSPVLLRCALYSSRMAIQLAVLLLTGGVTAFRVGFVEAFVPSSIHTTSRIATATTRLQSTAESTQAVQDAVQSPGTKTLGLLTFDLDDTLYAIAPVIDEANAAFARAMNKYGFPNIQPEDINQISVQLRKDMARIDPEAAAVLTHTETRKLAVRRAMEDVMLERKLIECAADWATNVESLGPAVVKSARTWSNKAVSSQVIDAVLMAWEMERHHAAERHLYREVIPALKQIRQDHPGVVIGAVTDGKANPMFMTFTLRNYFDFCMSWEDDQGGRKQFFRELSKVEGTPELSWIYNAALEKGKELAAAKAAITDAAECEADSPPGEKCRFPEIGSKDSVWIHVGDDLAYDVGGSSQCGAKTVLVELADKYGQTARHRFDTSREQPKWSVSSEDELKTRAVMNEAAKEFVDERLDYWHLLPELVNKIVDESGSNE